MKPGDVVFLSASVPYRPGWIEDAKPREIEEAIVCIARAVFARGGRLLFGGHPSVSPLIASVAGEYYAVDPRRVVRPIVTFQSQFFNKEDLPNETWDLYKMGWSAIEWTPAVANEDGSPDRDLSLELMRKRMLGANEAASEALHRNELTPPKVMIAVGGMEGVRDEAGIFLRVSPAPLFAVTSGGGAARRILKDPDPRLQDRILPLEKTWKAQLKVDLPSDMQFEPYAAMAQWLMESI